MVLKNEGKREEGVMTVLASSARW